MSTGSNGFTFLDDAFDMTTGGGSDYQQQQMPQLQQKYASPAPAAAPQGTRAQQQQQEQAQAQAMMMQAMMQDMAKFIDARNRETRDHQEQLYSSYVSKQNQTTETATQVMKTYCSSLEMLLFIIISALIVILIVQIVIVHKITAATGGLK